MRDEEMIDDALDREIARAMAVEPSPAFVARIRRRITATDVSRAWTLSSMSSMSWMAVAGGTVVAAGIAYVIASNSGRVAPAMPPLLSYTIPAAAVPGAHVPVVAPGTVMFDGGHVVTPTRARSGRRTTPRPNAEPEILVDPREARALRLLLDDVVSGRIDVMPLLDAFVPPVMATGPAAGIYIAPIEWSPLTEQGVSQ